MRTKLPTLITAAALLLFAVITYGNLPSTAGDADGLRARGNAQAAKGDFTAAIKSFSDAIAANPQSASARVPWLGHGKAAEYERAIADYTSAIVLDAKNVDVYKKARQRIRYKARR